MAGFDNTDCVHLFQFYHYGDRTLFQACRMKSLYSPGDRFVLRLRWLFLMFVVPSVLLPAPTYGVTQNTTRYLSAKIGLFVVGLAAYEEYGVAVFLLADEVVFRWPFRKIARVRLEWVRSMTYSYDKKTPNILTSRFLCISYQENEHAPIRTIRIPSCIKTEAELVRRLALSAGLLPPVPDMSFF